MIRFGKYRSQYGVQGEFAKPVDKILDRLDDKQRTYFRHMLLIHFFYYESSVKGWEKEIASYFEVSYVKGKKGNVYPNWGAIYYAIYGSDDDQFDKKFEHYLNDLRDEKPTLNWDRDYESDFYKEMFHEFIRECTKEFAKLTSVQGRLRTEDVTKITKINNSFRKE